MRKEKISQISNLSFCLRKNLNVELIRSKGRKRKQAILEQTYKKHKAGNLTLKKKSLKQRLFLGRNQYH